MPLSDYSTPAEKIAALKAAMMDPALIHMATSNFTTTENIYRISRSPFINGIDITASYDSNLSIPSITPTGSVLTDLTEHSMIFLYVKDSDIVYSDPVTTYQNRLVSIIEAELVSEDSYVVVNAGTYGSMVKSLSNNNELCINSKRSGVIGRTSTPLQVVIPNENTFESNNYAAYGFEYIDLPSDW